MPVIDGSTTVAAAGTAEPLIATSTTVLAVKVQAKAGNTGVVYVGASTVAAGRGIELAAGERLEFPGCFHVDDLAFLHVDAATTGDGVTWVATTPP